MKKLLPLLPLLVWPELSLAALEMDYYTYNAFEESVAAFQRMALIFSDSNFYVLVGIMVIAGIFFGAAMTAGKGFSGQKVNPIAFMFPVFLGAAVFQGIVFPTGRIHIYDPVRNAYQAVDDVPDIIILMAGGLSLVERSVTSIVDTASAKPYADTAGGISYSIINAAIGTPLQDRYLEKTLSRYYEDCGIPSMSRNINGSSSNEVKRTSTDLYDAFAKFNHPSLFTVYYSSSPADDQGVVHTCKDTWDLIKGRLNTASTYNAMRDVICTTAGFDFSDAVQANRCNLQIETASELFVTAGANNTQFLRSFAIAQTISDALQSPDLSEAQRMSINRQIMAEGIGSNEAMGQWVPKLKGFMLAICLGIFPICALFIVTPLFVKALALSAGMFIWLTMWSICDVISGQMALDSAADAFSQITRYNLSYEAIMLAPEASVQALGIFGKARTMAFMLATVMTGGLFKLASSYAFTQMAAGWQNHLDQIGEMVGSRTMLGEQTAAHQQELMNTPGTMGTLANHGFTNAAFSSTMGQQRQVAGAEGFIGKELETGRSPLETLHGMGRTSMQEDAQGFRGKEDTANRLNLPVDELAGRAARSTAGRDSSRQYHEGEADKHNLGTVYDAGKQDALLTSAGRGVQSEKARELTGDSEINWSSAEDIARLDEASRIAASRNANGDPERIIGHYEGDQLKGIGATDAIKGEEHAHGFYGERDSRLNTQAFEAGAMTFGERALLEARKQQTGIEGGTGKSALAAGQSGLDVGEQIGTLRYAEDSAAVGRLATIAGAEIRPFNIGELTDAKMHETANFDYSITESNMDEVFDRYGINEETQALIREHGGAAGRFTVDPNTGQALLTEITAGSETRGVNHVSTLSGRSDAIENKFELDNSSRKHYDRETTGGMAAIQSEGAVQRIAYDAFDNEGRTGIDDAAVYEYSQLIRETMQSAGFSGTAADAEIWQKGGRFEAGLDSQGSLIGNMLGKVFLGAHANVSGFGSETYSDESTTSADIYQRAAEDYLKESREKGIEKFDAEYGPGAFDDLTPEQQNLFYRDLASSIEDDTRVFVDSQISAAKEQTQEIIQDNDAAEKARVDDEEASQERRQETRRGRSRGGSR